MIHFKRLPYKAFSFSNNLVLKVEVGELLTDVHTVLQRDKDLVHRVIPM